MYQFFVEDEQIFGDTVRILGPDVNHIRNVLRMRRGERVRVSSAQGTNYLCSVADFEEEAVLLDVVEAGIGGTELPADIYLFQGIPKGERMETVIEKAVELGVHEIIPVAMRRCVVRLDEKKAAKKEARWQEIARSAAKQAKRSIVPRVHPVMEFGAAAEYAARCGVSLVPYENEEGMAATRELFAALKGAGSISVFIGPEGGFAEEEIDALRGRSRVFSLGKRILRTDTASIAVLSMLMLALEMQDGEE